MSLVSSVWQTQKGKPKCATNQPEACIIGQTKVLLFAKRSHGQQYGCGHVTRNIKNNNDFSFCVSSYMLVTREVVPTESSVAHAT